MRYTAKRSIDGIIPGISTTIASWSFISKFSGNRSKTKTLFLPFHFSRIRMSGSLKGMVFRFLVLTCILLMKFLLKSMSFHRSVITSTIRIPQAWKANSHISKTLFVEVVRWYYKRKLTQQVSLQ